MYNLLIAIGIGIASAVLLTLTPLTWVESILPGIAAFVVAWFLLARRTGRQLEAVFKKAMKELEQGRFEQAIQTFKSAYAFERWQFLVRSQVDAQVGAILYLQRKSEEAEPYLRRAFVRHWVAQGMLACLLFRRHKLDEAKKVLEKAIAVNRKEPLLYGLYAYLLGKANRKEEAIAVLQRGVTALPSHGALKENLLALQNHRKLDMSGFGDAWYQFLLEMPPQSRLIQMQQQMQMRGGFRHPPRALR